MNTDGTDVDKRVYYREMIETVVQVGCAEGLIKALCHLIQQMTVDQLHIIGDIFDRGPRADRILDELMKHHDVDIQWGNHDVTWIGAMCGNPVCLMSVLRIAISYNGFDCLEDGYGINLRPLSMFAATTYANDPLHAARAGRKRVRSGRSRAGSQDAQGGHGDDVQAGRTAHPPSSRVRDGRPSAARQDESGEGHHPDRRQGISADRHQFPDRRPQGSLCTDRGRTEPFGRFPGFFPSFRASAHPFGLHYESRCDVQDCKQ